MSPLDPWEHTMDILTDARGVEYVEDADYARLLTLPHGWSLCETCHRAWNDSKGTSVTPAPAGRCPFEYDHEDEPISDSNLIRVLVTFTDEAAARTGVATVERSYDKGAIGSYDKALADLLALALTDGLSQDDVLSVTAGPA